MRQIVEEFGRWLDRDGKYDGGFVVVVFVALLIFAALIGQV